MHTAAEESGTGKASASAEALAKARQEADEVRERLLIEESLRRRAEADLKEAKGALNVGVARCEETKGENEVLTAAVVSSKEGEDKSALMGGKAKVRYKADLAIAQEQRDRLEAERRKLQKRVTDMEVYFILVWLEGNIFAFCNDWFRPHRKWPLSKPVL